MANIVEREHQIGLFDELVCRGGGTVQLVSGPNPHLVVVGPQDLVDRTIVRYRGTRLVVAQRVGPNPIHHLQDVLSRVRTIVVTDSVTRVAVQGVVNLELGESPERPFTVESIKLIHSGSGYISGNLSAGTIDVRIRGIGDVDLDGDAELLNVRVSGIGSLDGSELVCKRARVNISGVGSCRVMVLDDLAATVSGTGRLSYRGSARLTRRKTSTGRIEHLE
jgi:putative autotransporter adhesin-like protein